MSGGVGSSSEKLNNGTVFTDEVISALDATQELQNNVHKLLETFTTWESQDPDASVNSVKDTIKAIQSSQSKLEKTASTFPKLPDAQPVSLGNSGLITLDSGEDKSTLYKDLLHAYSWVSKLNEDANSALARLKRKYPEPERLFPGSNKRPKDSTRFLQDICPVLQLQHPDLVFEFNDKHLPCLKVTLKGVLSALVFFSGCVLDRVIIRGYADDINEDDKQNISTPSKFVTFRKITDVAQSAILNLSSSSDPERSIKAFVKWLSLYKTLFTEKCEQCKRHLKSDTTKGYFLPPCWRDTHQSKPYHLTCR